MFKPQRSFSAGELAPELHSRADTDKYQAGAKELTNFVVEKFGGLNRRPGTEYVGECALNTQKKHDKWGPPRLIPWNAGADVGYVLEFSHKIMRVIRNGEYVKVGGGWSNINSVATSGLVTLNRKPPQRVQLKTGNALVQVKGVWAEAPELHDAYFRAGEYTDSANPTFYLHDFTDDTDANRRVTGSTVSTRGWIEVVYELTTPITLGAAREMTYSMSNNVMTLCHKDIPVLEVSKGSGNDRWSITSVFGTDGNVRVRSKVTGKSVKILPPTSVSTDAYRERNSSSVDKEKPWKRYCVTTVDGDGNESLPRYSNYIQKDPADSSDETALTHSGVTNGTTFVVKDGSAGASNVSIGFNETRGPSSGYSAVKLTIQPDDNPSCNIDGDQKFTIIGRDYFGTDVSETLYAANFEGDGDAATTYTRMLMTTTNYFREVNKVLGDRNMSSIVNGGAVKIGWRDWDWDNIQLSWPASSSKNDLASPVTYRVYRSDGGLFGLIGVMTANESGSDSTIRFTDSDRAADYTDTPPVISTPFPDRASDKVWKYALSPGAVCHYQQKRIVGGSDTFSSRLWASGTGRPGDFNTKHVLKSADPFYFDLASDKLQNVLHLLSLNKIVLFTDSGEWILEGDESGAISPTTINARQLSHLGSGILPPEMIGNDAVFYQPRGSIVRDLGYTFKGLEESGDLTIFAYHLLRNKQIVSWAYQRSPNSVLWCARDDGTLLSLTYVKEHRIMAWAKHELAGGGKVHQVCVIPEGQRDAVYMVVERTTLSEHDGVSKFFIERLSLEKPEDTRLSINSDSATPFNGWRNKSQSCGTMTLSNPDGTYGWTQGDKVRVTLTNPLFDPQSRFFALEQRTPIWPGDDVMTTEVKRAYDNFKLNNPPVYDRLVMRLKDTDPFVAGKKVIVGKEKLQVAHPGSIGQVLRPASSRAAYGTSGGWTGISGLRIVKYVSPTVVDAVVLHSAGIPAGKRDTALHVWSFAGVTFRNDALSITEISSGGYDIGASVTINMRCPTFISTSVDSGMQYHIGTPSTPTTNSIITVTSVTDDTTAVGTVSQAAVPAAAQNTYTYEWGRAPDKIYGLNHLRGEEVSIYGDGAVLSSPYNSAYATVTVASDGTATPSTPSVVAAVGLPYVSDLETLAVDSLGRGAKGDNHVIVGRATVDLTDSQGGHIGPVLPSTSTALTDMVALDLEHDGESTPEATARTGSYTTTMKGDWDENGKVAIRNVDPTPMNIRAVHPHVEASKRGSPR